jgi:hypothetical protein
MRREPWLELLVALAFSVAVVFWMRTPFGLPDIDEVIDRFVDDWHD